MTAAADAPRHQSVLLAEAVAVLAPAPGMRFLDCTLGAGGHAEALLDAGAEVVGVDRDPQARAAAAARLQRFGGRFSVRGGTFAAAAEDLLGGGERFSGVIADLGLSSMQIDDDHRGFSLRSASQADMRMGDGCAADVLALIDQLDEEALADVIWRYGEERCSRRVARQLKAARGRGESTGAQLAEAVRRGVPGHHPRHPAIRTFQALRIAVNDELGELERLLACLPGLLGDGGRAAVISFHSLEDRAVKTSFRAGLAEGRWREIARKVIHPSDAEIAANPRSHSARLRWAIR